MASISLDQIEYSVRTISNDGKGLAQVVDFWLDNFAFEDAEDARRFAEIKKIWAMRRSHVIPGNAAKKIKLLEFIQQRL